MSKTLKSLIAAGMLVPLAFFSLYIQKNVNAVDGVFVPMGLGILWYWGINRFKLMD